MKLRYLIFGAPFAVILLLAISLSTNTPSHAKAETPITQPQPTEPLTSDPEGKQHDI